MEKNGIIHLARWLVRIAMGILILVVVLLAFITVHRYFDPGAYGDWYLKDGYFPPGLTTISITFSEHESGEALSDIGHGWMIWILLRTTLISFLVFIILRKVLSILNSMQSLQTFYDGNIFALRTMAILALLLAAVACFNFGNAEGSFAFNLTIPFGPLLFGATCLVLSEVFKEGKILSDDSKSIV